MEEDDSSARHAGKDLSSVDGTLETDSSTVDGTLETDSSTVDGTLNTDLSTVDGTLKMDSSTLDGTLETDSSTVDGTLKTDSSTVDGTLKTDSSTVDGTLKTDSSAVDGSFKTDSSTVDGTLKTDSSTVDGTLKTDSSAVDGTLKTDSSTVDGTLKTDSSTVVGTLKKDSSTVDETLKTDLSTVDGTLKTDSSTVDGTLKTDSSTVDGTLKTDSSTMDGTSKTDSGEISTVSAHSESEQDTEELQDDLRAVGPLQESEEESESRTERSSASQGGEVEAPTKPNASVVDQSSHGHGKQSDSPVEMHRKARLESAVTEEESKEEDAQRDPHRTRESLELIRRAEESEDERTSDWEMKDSFSDDERQKTAFEHKKSDERAEDLKDESKIDSQTEYPMEQHGYQKTAFERQEGRERVDNLKDESKNVSSTQYPMEYHDYQKTAFEHQEGRERVDNLKDESKNVSSTQYSMEYREYQKTAFEHEEGEERGDYVEDKSKNESPMKYSLTNSGSQTNVFEHEKSEQGVDDSEEESKKDSQTQYSLEDDGCWVDASENETIGEDDRESVAEEQRGCVENAEEISHPQDRKEDVVCRSTASDGQHELSTAEQSQVVSLDLSTDNPDACAAPTSVPGSAGEMTDRVKNQADFNNAKEDKIDTESNKLEQFLFSAGDDEIVDTISPLESKSLGETRGTRDGADENAITEMENEEIHLENAQETALGKGDTMHGVFEEQENHGNLFEFAGEATSISHETPPESSVGDEGEQRENTESSKTRCDVTQWEEKSSSSPSASKHHDDESPPELEKTNDDVSPQEKSDDKDTDTKSQPTRMLQCPEHEFQALTHFCGICQEFTCSRCADDKHFWCDDVMTVSEAAGRKGTDLVRLRRDLDSTATKVKVRLETQRGNLAKWEKMREEGVKAIHMSMATLRQAIDEVESRLLTQMDLAMHPRVQEEESRSHSFADLESKLEAALKDSDDVSSRDSGLELLQQFPGLQAEADAILKDTHVLLKERTRASFPRLQIDRQTMDEILKQMSNCAMQVENESVEDVTDDLGMVNRDNDQSKDSDDVSSDGKDKEETSKNTSRGFFALGNEQDVINSNSADFSGDNISADLKCSPGRTLEKREAGGREMQATQSRGVLSETEGELQNLNSLSRDFDTSQIKVSSKTFSNSPEDGPATGEAEKEATQLGLFNDSDNDDGNDLFNTGEQLKKSSVDTIESLSHGEGSSARSEGNKRNNEDKTDPPPRPQEREGTGVAESKKSRQIPSGNWWEEDDTFEVFHPSRRGKETKKKVPESTSAVESAAVRHMQSSSHRPTTSGRILSRNVSSENVDPLRLEDTKISSRSEAIAETLLTLPKQKEGETKRREGQEQITLNQTSSKGTPLFTEATTHESVPCQTSAKKPGAITSAHDLPFDDGDDDEDDMAWWNPDSATRKKDKSSLTQRKSKPVEEPGFWWGKGEEVRSIFEDENQADDTKAADSDVTSVVEKEEPTLEEHSAVSQREATHDEKQHLKGEKHEVEENEEEAIKSLDLQALIGSPEKPETIWWAEDEKERRREERAREERRRRRREEKVKKEEWWPEERASDRVRRSQSMLVARDVSPDFHDRDSDWLDSLENQSGELCDQGRSPKRNAKVKGHRSNSTSGDGQQETREGNSNIDDFLRLIQSFPARKKKPQVSGAKGGYDKTLNPFGSDEDDDDSDDEANPFKSKSTKNPFQSDEEEDESEIVEVSSSRRQQRRPRNPFDSEEEDTEEETFPYKRISRPETNSSNPFEEEDDDDEDENDSPPARRTSTLNPFDVSDDDEETTPLSKGETTSRGKEETTPRSKEEVSPGGAPTTKKKHLRKESKDINDSKEGIQLSVYGDSQDPPDREHRGEAGSLHREGQKRNTRSETTGEHVVLSHSSTKRTKSTDHTQRAQMFGGDLEMEQKDGTYFSHSRTFPQDGTRFGRGGKVFHHQGEDLLDASYTSHSRGRNTRERSLQGEARGSVGTKEAHLAGRPSDRKSMEETSEHHFHPLNLREADSLEVEDEFYMSQISPSNSELEFSARATDKDETWISDRRELLPGSAMNPGVPVGDLRQGVDHFPSPLGKDFRRRHPFTDELDEDTDRGASKWRQQEQEDGTGVQEFGVRERGHHERQAVRNSIHEDEGSSALIRSSGSAHAFHPVPPTGSRVDRSKSLVETAEQFHPHQEKSRRRSVEFHPMEALHLAESSQDATVTPFGMTDLLLQGSTEDVDVTVSQRESDRFAEYTTAAVSFNRKKQHQLHAGTSDREGGRREGDMSRKTLSDPESSPRHDPSSVRRGDGSSTSRQNKSIKHRGDHERQRGSEDLELTTGVYWDQAEEGRREATSREEEENKEASRDQSKQKSTRTVSDVGIARSLFEEDEDEEVDGLFADKTDQARSTTSRNPFSPQTRGQDGDKEATTFSRLYPSLKGLLPDIENQETEKMSARPGTSDTSRAAETDDKTREGKAIRSQRVSLPLTSPASSSATVHELSSTGEGPSDSKPQSGNLLRQSGVRQDGADGMTSPAVSTSVNLLRSTEEVRSASSDTTSLPGKDHPPSEKICAGAGSNHQPTVSEMRKVPTPLWPHTVHDRRSSIISDVIMLSDDALVVCDVRNNCVKMFDVSSGNLLSHLPLTSSPNSVTLLSPGLLAVSGERALYLINATTGSSLVLTSSVMVPWRYWGLVALSSRDVIASRYGNHLTSALDRITLQGDVIYSVKEISTKHKFITPRYLALTSSKQVLVSDSGSKTLTCLTLEGVVTFTYPSADDPKLLGPGGVSCDVTGRIFLADKWQNRVFVLSPEGVLLQEIHGIANPEALTLTSAWITCRTFVHGKQMVEFRRLMHDGMAE